MDDLIKKVKKLLRNYPSQIFQEGYINDYSARFIFEYFINILSP